jgi:hypothetical protein
MKADPSTFWYQGELGFFDNYIIPLAKKLKECNVFGVSSGTSHRDVHDLSDDVIALFPPSSLPLLSPFPKPLSFAIDAMITRVRRRVLDLRTSEPG